MAATVEGKRVSKKAAKEAARQESIEWLRDVLKPGDTVYCVLRHVSRSGMMRHIDFYQLCNGKAEPRWLSWHIARALDMRTAEPMGSLKVGGCGMDMGFHVVYNLAATLYRGGVGCIGEGCLSNDHSNGDRDYTPHSCRGSVDAGFGHSHGDTHTVTGRAVKDELANLNPPRCCHWHSDGGYALRSRWL